MPLNQIIYVSESEIEYTNQLQLKHGKMLDIIMNYLSQKFKLLSKDI